MAMRVAGLLFGAKDGGSFVQSGLRGMEQAAGECDCDLEVHYCEATDAGLRTALLHDIAGTGPDLVILHGGQGEAPLAQVAAAWPQQRFAITQGSFLAPNVAAYEVLLEQPAYLAGALAAWSTRTGVIAHLSGEPVGPGLKGESAFRAGAFRADPGVTVASHFCGQQHDAELAAASVLAHVRRGADIVFTMLGRGRIGAIAACRDARVRQIGDGIDWCVVEPQVFIGSAVADAAWCCRQAIHDAAQGSFKAGLRQHVGLEQPDVCRLVMHPDVPKSIRDRVNALQVPVFV